MSLGQEQANSMVEKNTLLHGETLLVITTGDLEDVSLEFVPKGIGFNLLGDALVIENAQLSLIRDLDELLATCCWVSNIKLE